MNKQGRVTIDPHTGKYCKLVSKKPKGWYAVVWGVHKWSLKKVFLYNDEIDIISLVETRAWLSKQLKMKL